MTVALQVSDAWKAFGGPPVLRGIALSLGAGCHALLGANGSGKSTLMRCIAGIETLDRGKILIDGLPMQPDDVTVRQRFGHAPAPEVLPNDLTGLDCLGLVARLRGFATPPPDSLEDAVLLALTPWLDRRVGAYSLGTRQKLAMVLALIGRPPLVLLDETLSALDPLAAFAAKQRLRELAEIGVCSLVATHAVGDVSAWCDSALLLDGTILQHWDRAALTALQADAAFERAVVARLSDRA